MPKKIISIIFTFILVAVLFTKPLTAGAYEITEFSITAKAGMLASVDTGEILYSNNLDERVYPASITKLMTVLLILESDKYNPESKVTMTKEILDLVLGTGSAVSNLQAEEEITQLDLVYLVLMSSFGDCAYLAADFYGGGVDNFVAMMNNKAAELGLTGTHYSNPVGLHDEATYTTVRDIYTLTLHDLKIETFKTVCAASRYNMPATNKSAARTLSSTNFLIDKNTNYYYQYAKGIKTGYTDEAGRCLVSYASNDAGYTYICILMGCPPKADRRYEFLESADLYRWAFNNFSFKKVADSEEPVCEMPVNLSLDTDFVPLYFEKPFVTILPNNADDSTIVIKPHLKSESTDAPVKKGDLLGTADVIYAEQVIGTVNLVAGSDVKVSRLLVVFSYIKSIFTSIYMKLLIGLGVLVLLVFIFMCIRLNISRLKKRRVKYIPYNQRKGNDKHEH